jgi:Lon protease-like protein
LNVTFDHLPLFPLPLVLFPGTALPLHIFEHRYRTLLADCLEGDKRFGIVRLPENTAEVDIEPGTVGCIAEVVDTEILADGRSNIVVRGLERFALVSPVSSDLPYHVWSAVGVADAVEIGGQIEALAERVREVFGRVGRAARTLSDDPEPLPDLPDDPASLSFAIGAMIDIDMDTRQALLTSRSPVDRLERLDVMLSAALGSIVKRAHVHTLAKTNGRGSHVQP